MLLKWIEIVIVAACCAVGARHYIHMLQLESYQLPGYKRYLKRNFDKIMRSTVLVGVAFTMLDYVMPVILIPMTPGIPESRGSVATVIVMALSPLLFKEKLTALKFIAILTGVASIVFLNL